MKLRTRSRIRFKPFWPRAVLLPLSESGERTRKETGNGPAVIARSTAVERVGSEGIGIQRTGQELPERLEVLELR
jgi:hypothetical protein